MNSLRDLHEALGVVVVAEVPRAGQDLEAAVGHHPVGVLPVLDGDHVVLLAPDQRGHVLGEVEAVAGVHALALGVDDRARGVDEGPALAGVPQRLHALGQPLHVGVGLHAQLAEHRAHGAPAPGAPAS